MTCQTWTRIAGSEDRKRRTNPYRRQTEVIEETGTGAEAKQFRLVKDAAAVAVIARATHHSANLSTEAAAAAAIAAVQPPVGPVMQPPVAAAVQPPPAGVGAKLKRVKAAASTVSLGSGSKIAKQTSAAAKQLSAEAEKDYHRDNVSIFRQLE